MKDIGLASVRHHTRGAPKTAKTFPDLTRSPHANSIESVFLSNFMKFPQVREALAVKRHNSAEPRGARSTDEVHLVQDSSHPTTSAGVIHLTSSLDALSAPL